MFKFCKNCGREPKTDEYGDWVQVCKHCCHNRDYGISEYSSHWLPMSQPLPALDKENI